MTYTFALDNIKIEGCNFKFKISKYIFLNKKKLPKFSFCVILLLWMTAPWNNSNTVTTHESQVEFIRYCAHLSSIPSLPPSPLPPLPGCSPAGGPVIPAQTGGYFPRLCWAADSADWQRCGSRRSSPPRSLTSLLPVCQPGSSCNTE